jgi:Rrf2 family transcriptional regulator, cysteine metabolism repressor
MRSVHADTAMRLTSRSEYALLALIHLARQKGEGYVPVRAIAEAQKIPPLFLEQILLTMKRAHQVQSLKGQHGGYRLARRADEITLAEVVRLFDGALAPTDSASKHFHETTPIEKEKKVLRVLKQIRDYVSDTLEATTLADVS